jgi:hypothetical protein
MPRTSFQWLFIVIAATMAVLAPAGAVRAEMYFSVEVRETYEDNVIGLVSDNPNIVGGGGSAQSLGAGDTGAAGTIPAAGDAGGKRGGGHGGGAQAPKVTKAHGGGGIDERPITPPPTTSGPTGTAGGGAGGGAAAAIPAVGAHIAGDFSTSVNADIGNITELGQNLMLHLKADADHTSYQTYKQFDFTMGSVRAGLSANLTDIINAKVLARGTIKNFDISARNSTAYGATVSLKQTFSRAFWLKEVYDYEQNHANDSLFSYQGDSLSIWAGYTAMPRSAFGLGYSYLIRNFNKEAPVLKLTSQTFSVDWTWDFYTKWSLNVAYDLEKADSNLPGTATTNNVYSVGMIYSY